MKEIFPDDQTVCMEKYLEIMEVVVIGKEKDVRKVTTIKFDIDMPNKGSVKMTEIDLENFASLVQKSNKELEPVIDKLNQLIQDGKDPLATLEQAQKARKVIEEVIKQIQEYETKQDKKVTLDSFSELQKDIDKRIRTEKHKIFVKNLNEKIGREGAKTNQLIQQSASPATIIQEAKRFKGKVQDMMQGLNPNECDREKAMQDLKNITQAIDRVIKEQEEKMGGSKEAKTAPKFGTQQISQAAEEAVSGVKREVSDKNKAACNIGVNIMFQILTGSDELINKESKEIPQPPILANQMVDHWASSPNWEEVAIGQDRELALRQAHELANQGYFVIVVKILCCATIMGT